MTPGVSGVLGSQHQPSGEHLTHVDVDPAAAEVAGHRIPAARPVTARVTLTPDDVTPRRDVTGGGVGGHAGEFRPAAAVSVQLPLTVVPSGGRNVNISI